MVIYWKFQFYFDAVIIAFLAYLLPNGFFVGLPAVDLDPTAIGLSARMWLGPVLTLLGMICATTAFLFSAVDRSEFKMLREIGVESQLWSIFSELIFWLAVAAVSCGIISFVKYNAFPSWLLGYSLFLFLVVSFCLLKFAWVMRQILSVKMSK